MKYLRKFTNHTAYLAAENTLDKPNVSLCVQLNEVHYNPIPHDYSKDYLTFVALEDGTFQLSRNAVSYSLDNGETWTELAAATASPTVTAGNKIMWKGTITPTSYPQGIGKFSATGNFNVQGNAMSLLFGDDFKGQTDLAGKYFTFHSLFHQNTKVVNAKNLSLPATTLANYCYTHMFNSCTSLVTAPELSGTTLAEGCYYGMFNGCTSLTTAPDLPATTLTDNCYREMFYGCTSLTTAPELPAATLTMRCYASMFEGCTSLTTVPSVLPATTLASNCCEDMFQGCTSLTTAPVLPATTLTSNCYSNMFNGCTNLNYIKAMFTTTPSNIYTSNWVSGVSSTGTFVKNATAQWNVTSVNGVPSGWTVEKCVPTESSLIIYIDDFPEDKDYDDGSVQDAMIAEIENPIEKGANPYEYFGETIVYNGNTYYLWQAIDGSSVDNENTKYFATTTVDFNTLYSQSLEDDLNNHFTSAIGVFDDSKSIYIEQGELPDGSDIHYLVKVENLE